MRWQSYENSWKLPKVSNNNTYTETARRVCRRAVVVPSRLLFESLNGFCVLDNLDVVGLGCTAWYELEVGILAEVLELLAWCPADVDFLDVGSGEVLCGDGSFAGQFNVEGSEVAQPYLVACKQLLTHTSHCIGQDTFYGTFREGAVVVCNVLTEIIKTEHFVNLRSAIGLGLGNVGLLSSGLCAHNCNTVVNHSGTDPLPNPCLRREWGLALLCGAAMTFSLCSKVSSRP